MKNENWEIKVIENIGMLTVSVYMFQKSDKVCLAHFKDGQIILEELHEGSLEPLPTMKIPYDVWNALKRTMIDDKVREKSEVEAELGATKYHLEDMRKLLKIK